ncbi:Zinc binding oxidoreductase [Trichostrongylus colubriformis]|uniref:Zinc binding oxidoreductase n=1 Tax=Trichostrongylus colubriformis TaxID=6319 RepID=A0AAN8J2F0_TRICO
MGIVSSCCNQSLLGRGKSGRTGGGEMLAAVVKEFGGPNVIKVLSNVPIPVIQSSEQILIRVAASGVNPVDTYIRNGQYASKPNLPYTPGKDGAGIVADIGSEVRDVEIGDRVYFAFSVTGSAAEYCLTDRVFPLPSEVTFQEGACIGIPYFTAHRALFVLGKVQKGQRVLVHGASGGVGIAAVQMAADYGAVVVGTAGTDEGMDLVKQNGATEAFNHKARGYVKAIMEKYPEGFDLIVEMAAHLNLKHDLDMLARKGKVAIVGSRGEIKIDPRAFMMKETSVFGLALANSTPDDWEMGSSHIYNLLSSSHYRPIIERVYPLEDISTAHKDVMAARGTRGKLILSINDKL